MPRIDFDEEHKAKTTNYDYPKLKLKKGERARIAVLEPVEFEWTHSISKPVIVDGVPKMITRERKNGSTYEAHKMQFVSKSLCIGDAATLKEHGSDPRNCPICKLARDYPDMAKGPKRRFAMNVIRYRTKAGTFDVTNQFSVDVLVWAFTDETFNKLADFKKTWGPLQNHDLLLGPCKDEDYQTFEISIAPEAEWSLGADRKKITAETFKESRWEDLTVAIGTQKQRSWMEDDVQIVMEAWQEVSGIKARNEGSLADDLSGLLDTPPDVATEAISDDEVDENGVMIFDPVNAVDGPTVAVTDDNPGETIDLLASLTGISTGEEPVAEASSDEPDDFAKLLADMG